MSSKTKTAKKNTASKQGAQPKLRFPEFRDAGDWEEKPLRELFSERQETGFTSLQLLSLTEKEGVIPQEDSNRKNNSNPNKSKYLRVCPGDIVYNTMRMWEGRSALVNLEGLVSPAYTVCRPKNHAISEFFAYYFKTHSLIKQFHKYSQGLVKDTLNLKFPAFAQISIATSPIPEEQKKIADCLASIDESIEAERQKLYALRDHKKGLMQELFPAEGETLPKRRLPEFHNSPEWEIKKLGDLLFDHPDYGVNAPSVPFTEDLPAYLRITDISEDGYFRPEKKTSVDIEAKNESYLNEGDIVLARTGASVGKSYKYRKSDGRLVFAGFLIRIKPCTKKIDPTFLFNYFATKQYWNWVKITSARSGQPGINGNEYADLLIQIPPSSRGKQALLEQQRIADCLSSIDNIILLQSKKIDALQDHKEGLMQQFFPAASEVQ